MDRAHLLIVAASTVALAWLIATRAQDEDTTAGPALPPPEPPPEPETITDTLSETLMATIRTTFRTWRPPAVYAQAIAQAEDANGIPRDMLARLLWQESRYRADIIDGRTRSPAGALGIAQFMPATAREMGIDPLDPFAAITAAARYLAGLYRRFGDWSRALAAYNWGQGNVSRRGLAAAPLETRRYYAQILADVNAAHGTDYA